MPAILVSVLQSEGFYLDPAQYERYIKDFLTNATPGVSDAYGDSQPQVYAYGVLKPQFEPMKREYEEVVDLITTCIGCIRTGARPGPEAPSSRRTLFLTAGFDGQTWRIVRLKGGHEAYLNPNDPFSDIFQIWQRW